MTAHIDSVAELVAWIAAGGALVILGAGAGDAIQRWRRRRLAAKLRDVFLAQLAAEPVPIPELAELLAQIDARPSREPDDPSVSALLRVFPADHGQPL